MKGSFAGKMAEGGPEALEMPENVSESGMMMGAMVMAKTIISGRITWCNGASKRYDSFRISKRRSGWNDRCYGKAWVQLRWARLWLE